MKKKPAFIPFLVVGDPDLGATARAVDLLIEAGADWIELGVPFSDAMADGPVIQFASERAAERVTLADVLKFAHEMGAKHPGFPFVLFTYYNPILRFGLERFSVEAKAAGITAVLVVDLPPEESGEYRRLLTAQGVQTVYLASPTTSRERLIRIDEASTGFIYYVSRAGVTGVQAQLSDSLESELKGVRELTNKPVAVGFGISTGEQAAQVARLADAVVVGSAFVKLLAQPDLEAGFREMKRLAREIREGIDSAVPSR
jgi:tryptophan synthase alpha chain